MASAGGGKKQSRPSGRLLDTQLGLIARMSQEFASSLDVDVTLDKALGEITQHIGAEGGAVFLIDESGEQLVCRASSGPEKLVGIRLSVNEGIVGRSVRDNACQMVRDVFNDPSFQPRIDHMTGFTTRSILCAPLSVHDQCLGAIEVVNKKGEEALFDDEDKQLLQTMTSSAALALLNARMAAHLMEQERDRRELEIAAEIQRSLLPKEQPPPFPVSGINLPARLVSGDFFDFLVLDDGRISFSVGDVSGKGVRAALLMAKTASLYRCLVKSEHSPGRLLAVVNEEICETATRGMFVTMVVGILDPASGTIRIANAGHEPPLLHLPDGSFSALPAQAPPLGILTAGEDGPHYTEDEIMLEGGTLYVFTDGVTEACSTAGGQVGLDGLKTFIEAAATVPLPERLTSIVRGLTQRPLRDDLTILAADDLRAKWMTDPAGGALLSKRFSARPDQLRAVRAAVKTAVLRGGCSASCAEDIIMAVDEACQNIIRHAYKGDPKGKITVEIQRRGQQIVCWLRDFAPKVDVSTVRSRELDDVRPGGLGVHLIREVMDESGFIPCPSDQGNIFRMTKQIS